MNWFESDTNSPEYLVGREPLPLKAPDLTGLRVLVTGGLGFLGRLVGDAIIDAGGEAVPGDLPYFDVTRPNSIASSWKRWEENPPNRILHLAAHKEAIQGEEKPEEVSLVNIMGTANLAELKVPIVLASTCKAADPCTAYGASKLIAERIVLNAGGTVVRLVNVLGSSRSVLEIWDEIPAPRPIPVTACERIWMTPNEAVLLLLNALVLDPGRYGPDVGAPEPVALLARRRYEDRPLEVLPPRRGDRYRERLISENEIDQRTDRSGIIRIRDLWEVEPFEHPLPKAYDATPLEQEPTCEDCGDFLSAGYCESCNLREATGVAE